MDGCYNGVGGGNERNGGIFGEPCEGVGDAECFGSGCPDCVTAIVCEGRAEVEPHDPVRGPRCSFYWLFVDEDSGAEWCYWMGPEVVGPTVQPGIGRDSWVRSIWRQVIESEENLG